jgi:IS1 family transposase
LIFLQVSCKILDVANVLKPAKRAAIAAALCEGNSIRATARLADVSYDAVAKLGLDLGEECIRYMDVNLRNLQCRRLEVDEIWAFCRCKAKNVRPENVGTLGYGDLWAFTAVDPVSKLIPAFHIGHRDAEHATIFMQDLASRLAHRVALVSDGHRMYLEAVESAFGSEVDFAQLIKEFKAGPPDPDHRYSPQPCVRQMKAVITGNPDKAAISTSLVERSNLTVRMMMRRYTRLTNGFSKRLRNHVAAFGLFAFHYNYVRIHRSLRVTPAMAAGVTAHLWSVAEMVALLPNTVTGKKRGPYKKQQEAA